MRGAALGLGAQGGWVLERPAQHKLRGNAALLWTVQAVLRPRERRTAEAGCSPASFSSGRASSEMGGLEGGRLSCITSSRFGEKDSSGSGGASTMSAISLGGRR